MQRVSSTSSSSTSLSRSEFFTTKDRPTTLRPRHVRTRTRTKAEPKSSSYHHHHHRHHNYINKEYNTGDWSNLRLPPLTYPSSIDIASSFTPPMPNFGMMPPIEHITSLALSGCTCGVGCACPGCAEHMSSSSSSDDCNSDSSTCGHGCGNCIDPTLAFSLPTSTGIINPKETLLDRFFACAASLPPPPSHRRSTSTIQLNPVDTTMYPNKVGVNLLPKLESSAGRCSCPDGQCSCDKLECGCGERHKVGVNFS